MTPLAVRVVYEQAKGFRHSGRGIRKLDLVVGCTCRLECPVCVNGTGVVGGRVMDWSGGMDWSGSRDWRGVGTGVGGWSEG